MDDLEQYAGLLLFAMIFARLAREVKGVLQPLGVWPKGVKAKDSDHAFLTPEDEFARWAKSGVAPGGKRMAVSVTAALLALICVPVWARTTWTVRATLPLAAIETEATSDTPALEFPPPSLKVLSFSNTDGPGAESDADTIWAELSDMRGDGKDVRIELAVVTAEGQCVTRGRVEVQDDADDDDESIETLSKTKQQKRLKNSPCCFGHEIRELWMTVDGDVDDWLERKEDKAHVSCGSTPDTNNLILLPSDGAEVELVMGVRKFAWVRYPAGGGRGRQTGAEKAADAARRAAPVAGRYFAHGRYDGDGSHSSFFHSARPDGAATLSFTLANALPDRSGHNYAWRFGTDIEHPFVVKASDILKRTVTLTSEGQVLRHVESSFVSDKAVWDGEKKAFVLPSTELPFFVDGDWSLDTSVEESSVSPLHFVVYVPPRDKCPLVILNGDGEVSETNAFDIAEWGSVVVWNPPTCLGGVVDGDANEVEDGINEEDSLDDAKELTRREKQLQKKNQPRDWGRVPSLIVMTENVTSGNVTYLDTLTVDHITQVFAASLRRSFGFPSNAPGHSLGETSTLLELGVAAPKSATTIFGTPEKRKEVKPLTLTSMLSGSGFAVWEVDVIARRRAVQVAQEARSTLASLAEIATKLPDMHIPQELADESRNSLQALLDAREAALSGRGDDAVGFARAAHQSAEESFYDPKFNAEMYFPPEFTLAVYVPLFLPTAFPLLIGVMWDVRHFLRRRRCAAAWRAGARSLEDMKELLAGEKRKKQ